MTPCRQDRIHGWSTSSLCPCHYNLNHQNRPPQYSSSTANTVEGQRSEEKLAKGYKPHRMTNKSIFGPFLRKKIGRKWGTKNWDSGSIMAVKTTFLPFWASEWVPSVWKGRRKTGHHMASLWTPHMPIFWRKKIGQKRDPQIWDLGSGMAQKWSKTIQMPIICMKSSYLTNYYPHFIDFKMLRLIWTKMAETP